MKHRQFKTECICMVMINDKLVICNYLSEIRKKIYAQGRREEKYVIDVCDKRTGAIYDTYLMKYTKEGPIFTKQVYSMWKECKKEAITKQKNIFID